MDYPTNVNVLTIDDFSSETRLRQYREDCTDALLFFREFKAPVYSKDFYAAVVQAFGPDATAEALAVTKIRGVTA